MESQKPKVTDMAGGSKLKLAFCFMEIAHEPLHLGK
jgi:hypothetical protein